MSACGTFSTVLNYTMMAVLILASLHDMGNASVKTWRSNCATGAFFLGVLWFLMSIWQLVNA